MRDTFKKQFQILWDGGVLMLLFTVILYVFGLLLFSGIAYFDNDLTSCFPMGTLLACIMAAMYISISLVGIGGIFNLEISMGCTRHRFFVSYYLVHFMFCIASLIPSARFRLPAPWVPAPPAIPGFNCQNPVSRLTSQNIR